MAIGCISSGALVILLCGGDKRVIAALGVFWLDYRHASVAGVQRPSAAIVPV
jgi:hypothetical protein